MTPARAWRYCTEVLDVYIRSVFFSLPMPCIAQRRLAQWQHTPTRSMNECGLEAMLSDWLVWCWTCTCAWLGQSDCTSYLLFLFLPALYVTFVFLSSTWSLLSCMIVRYLGGKKVFLAVPHQVKMCAFSGLLYAIVGTLPSFIMKYDLPCFECNTEEW